MKNMTIDDVKRARLYKLYINGYAYIPIQDLASYERSYYKVYG